MSSIKEHMINQIRENINWLVKNTDVAWDIVEAVDGETDETLYGIRFRDSVSTLATIWEES